MTPVDTLGRPLRDLRISVTDRCNFRCTYCMPSEVFGHDYQFLRRAELLTFEEIARLAGIFAAQGVEKIRLTGGEPLLRRDVDRLVAMLAEIPGLDLTLTTNGSLLPQKAPALAAAGLRRITVSLDSLDDEVFRAMNDVDFPVARVLEGIEAAAEAGLRPVKVNMVVKRGVNDDSVVDMARHFRGTGHIVRFIEYMDVGHTNGWRLDDVVPAAEIVETIDRRAPARAARAPVPGRGGPALALPGRRRGDRRDRLGHAALLRSLHPRAAVGRRQALHLPVRGAWTRPAGAPARRRRGRASSPTRSRAPGAAAPIATRSSARPRRPRCPRSRCPTSGDSKGGARAAAAGRRLSGRLGRPRPARSGPKGRGYARQAAKLRRAGIAGPVPSKRRAAAAARRLERSEAAVTNAREKPSFRRE